MAESRASTTGISVKSLAGDSGRARPSKLNVDIDFERARSSNDAPTPETRDFGPRSSHAAIDQPSSRRGISGSRAAAGLQSPSIHESLRAPRSPASTSGQRSTRRGTIAGDSLPRNSPWAEVTPPPPPACIVAAHASHPSQPPSESSRNQRPRGTKSIPRTEALAVRTTAPSDGGRRENGGDGRDVAAERRTGLGGGGLGAKTPRAGAVGPSGDGGGSGEGMEDGVAEEEGAGCVTALCGAGTGGGARAAPGPAWTRPGPGGGFPFPQ